MRKGIPIFYNALLLTAVNLLLRMVSTSFQVYLSGQIGASGVGLLQLVLSVGGLAMTAGIAGVRTATMYLTAEELGKGRRGSVLWVLSAAFVYSILCSGAIAALLLLLAPSIATDWIGDGGSVDSIRLLAAFLPINCLTGVMTGYFTAANRIRTLAAVEVAEQGCSMLCTVFLLKTMAGEDAGRACQAVILGSGTGAVLTLLCLIFLRCREHHPFSPKIPVARRLTDIALPLAVADDLKAGISTIENLMVPKRLALYRGVSDPLALFGTVCGMVFPLLMFPTAILFGLTELLIPEMARCNAAGSHRRIHYLMRRSLRLALLYGIFCGGVLYVTAPQLCFRLYGSGEAGRYLRWFAPLTVMLYCDIVTDAIIKGLGQQKASVRYNILTSGMDVILLFLWLPQYGMVGYYASFLLTHALNFALSLGRLLKITGQRLRIRQPAAALIAGGAAVTAASYVTSPVLRVAVFVILLGCGLTISGVTGKKDLRWIRGLILPQTEK